MTFRWPILLWMLVLVPVGSAAYLWWLRQRVTVARRFARPAMQPNVVPVQPGWRRHVPVVLYLVASAALILALARPQAAFSVPRETATVMLVIDSSHSMHATDVEPNRLVAAQDAANAFLDEVPEDFQVGVVTFADRARVLSVPTTDRPAVRRALEGLEMELGTAIGDGIWRGLLVQQPQQERSSAAPVGALPPTAMVLLSDGNNTTGGMDPVEAARRAQQAGARIYTVAVGEQEPPPGWKGPKPPDDDLLREVATITHGAFFAAPTHADLERIFRDLGSGIATVTEQREVTSSFVGAGLLLLLLGGGISALWFNRIP